MIPGSHQPRRRPVALLHGGGRRGGGGCKAVCRIQYPLFHMQHVCQHICIDSSLSQGEN